MEFINLFLENLFLLADAMSFYILLGLLLAGVLKQLIRDDFISSHLGKSKTSSVIKATILGIPMPVCSCSVIPLAKSLQKEGASKGAVQSFLISTPITGVDSILATYSFFGWIFTIYRVITSVIIAILTGLFQNYFDNKEQAKQTIKWQTTNPNLETSALSFYSSKEESSCCSSSSCCDSQKKKDGFVKRAFTYAYVTLFEDIYFSLFLGLIIGALFTTFLPKELLQPLFEYQFLTYIAVLIIAMPLYVCATASLPIAAAFILSGMSSGAAFVFLSAGPATNSITMGVVASMFGKKSLFIYIGTIAVLSIIFGYIFDTYFGALDIASIHSHADSATLLDKISSIIMFCLIGYYIIKKKF